jgi:type I restriction enzyme S subunit
MADWNTVKLGTVGSFQNGEAFSSAFFNFEKKGLRLVRNRDLKNDDQIVYYNGEHGDHDVVNDGDLLVGMDGDFAPVIWKKGKALLNQRVGRVIVKDGVSQDYIYYALFSALAELEHVTSATTVKHLSSKTCLGLGIPLPPLAEQRKVAEILRTWDEAIESSDAELKAKQERKRGLMQKLLAPIGQGSGKSIDWVKIKLGELGEFYSGLSGKSAADFGSGSPFISYNSVFGRSRCFIEGQPLVRVEQGENQNIVTYGDIILTGSSETADEVAMSSLYCDQEPAHLNSFCIGYSYDKQRLFPEYAEQYFRGQAFRRSVFPLAQGSTRFNISKDGLAKVEIQIPPISEQRKISKILLSADGDIELIYYRIEALRTQKRGLMQKLLTGEVRVNS